MRRFLAFLIALTGLAQAAPAQEIRVMDRVFLVPDKPGAPMRFEMIVNAGCNDEAYADCRGLAHYLEHLILVGRNPEHQDTAFRFFADASSNGWTNARATVFLHNVPARPNGSAADVERLFQFYAARLRDFNITEEDAARERNVVLQEHDWRVQSNPSSLFFRDQSRRLIPEHVSGQWTIGTRDTIKALTLDQARAFHRAWYAPNNVWFVVRADMTPEALRAIASKALAGIEPRPLPPRNYDAPLVNLSGRLDERSTDPKASQPSVTVTRLVRIPDAASPAMRAARSLLVGYFGSQLAGSPYDLLVEEREIAQDRVGVWLNAAAPGVYIFGASATPAEGVTPEQLRDALIAWMDGNATRPPPTKETLDRLRKRWATARALADKQPAQVQSRLVNWLAEGLRYEDMAKWPGQLQEVQPADVEKVMRAIAAPGRTVVGILEPEMKP